MHDETNSRIPSEPPAPMSTLEGVGSLSVIGGLLVCVGTVASPDLASTLLPLGAFGCLVGLLVVWVARRARPSP
jgi:hypothetical protein